MIKLAAYFIDVLVIILVVEEFILYAALVVFALSLPCLYHFIWLQSGQALLKCLVVPVLALEFVWRYWDRLKVIMLVQGISLITAAVALHNMQFAAPAKYAAIIAPLQMGWAGTHNEPDTMLAPVKDWQAERQQALLHLPMMGTLDNEPFSPNYIEWRKGQLVIAERQQVNDIVPLRELRITFPDSKLVMGRMLDVRNYPLVFSQLTRPADTKRPSLKDHLAKPHSFMLHATPRFVTLDLYLNEQTRLRGTLPWSEDSSQLPVEKPLLTMSPLEK